VAFVRLRATWFVRNVAASGAAETLVRMADSCGMYVAAVAYVFTHNWAALRFRSVVAFVADRAFNERVPMEGRRWQ